MGRKNFYTISIHLFYCFYLQTKIFKPKNKYTKIKDANIPNKSANKPAGKAYLLLVIPILPKLYQMNLE